MSFVALLLVLRDMEMNHAKREIPKGDRQTVSLLQTRTVPEVDPLFGGKSRT